MLPFIFLVIGVLAQQTFAEEPEPIVGGQPALPGEFPHQVSLRYYGSHTCGGSIFAPTKILTAAHCVDGISPRSLKIATSTISLTGGKLHDVAKIVIHPEYSDRVEDAWKNDVAVITLTAPIEYDKYQSPIALATSRPSDGQQCILSGWGKISTHGSLPQTLQKMNQVVVSQSNCQERHNMPLTGSHLCAYNRYGIGACQGDSGGPLISNGKQVGITSWVLPCAKGYPDAYTDVSYHIKFINES